MVCLLLQSKQHIISTNILIFGSAFVVIVCHGNIKSLKRCAEGWDCWQTISWGAGLYVKKWFLFISFTILFLSNIFFFTFVRSKLQKIRMKMIQQEWVSSASEALPCLRNIGNFLRCCLSSFHIILPLVSIHNFIFVFQHIVLFRIT